MRMRPAAPCGAGEALTVDLPDLKLTSTTSCFRRACSAVNAHQRRAAQCGASLRFWRWLGGLVTVEGFLNRNEQGIPPSWCGGVSGDQSNIIDSPEEFQKLIDSGKDMTGYYCRVGWKWQPLMNCGFRVWCLETLKPMVEDPEDLRVLIGFDS